MQANEPPNFNGSYPLAGETIGPAWRLAWRYLVDAHPRWTPSTTLSTVMSEAGIQDKTAKGLLATARGKGILAVRHRDGGQPSRRRAEYRIARG